MTTLVRSWTVSFSQVPSQATLDAQGKAVTYAFIGNYLSAGWTCEGSSNSSAGAMDGVNRISASTALVWAAAGVAHSWIVLKSPAGFLPNSKFVWLQIACSTGASSQHQWNLKWAPAAFIGGSATADPTAPAQAGSFTSKQYLPSSLTNVKYHTLRNTTGDVINMVSTDGTGIVQHASWALSAAPNASSVDNYPFHAFATWSTTGAPTIGNTQVTTASIMFWNDATLYNTNLGLGILRYVLSTSTDFMAQVPLAGQSHDNSYPDLPAILFTSLAGKVALHGTLVDIALGPSGSGVVTPTVEPSVGSPQTVLIHDFWFPAGGATPVFT